MNNNKIIITIIIIVIIITAILAYFIYKEDSSEKYDLFAQCLNDKNAVFYGAFWCPHCQNQKALFGKSVKLLNYIECSTPDGKFQTQICQDKKIESYPTWEFADGSRESGELSLKKLSEKTSCPLQQ